MRRKIIPYKPYLKSYAKKLRKNMTHSEVLLWNCLKRKQLMGYQFNRQRPINKYIVDFYCKELKLAIEIDGSSHDDPEIIKYDKKRQKELEKLGVKFIRFPDKFVKQNMDEVINQIIERI